jgi:uncharacterized damage-inducible protein DinB
MTVNTKDISENIRQEYESARADFHRVLDAFTPADLSRRSNNPGWTNAELLFHITLGFMLIPRLSFLIRLFSRLPRGVSRTFAWLLNTSTPLFDRINGWGPHGGARLYSGKRLAAKFDRSIDAALKTADSISEGDWLRSMAYPTRWDPMIDENMTLEGLFHYMVRHMEFHKTQLSSEKA